MISLLPWVMVLVAPSKGIDLDTLTRMTSRFAPSAVVANLSHLSAGDKAALTKVIEAGKYIDTVYMRQLWGRNEVTLLDLARDTSDLGHAQLSYFLLNKGPWSVIDKMQPFLPDIPPAPLGAGFYPEDLTKAQLEAWLQTLPAEQKKLALSPLSVIRRKDGKLQAVPYSEAYQAEFLVVSQLLADAALLVKEPSLKKYLAERSRAFLNNDYGASEVQWNDVQAALEVFIGPAKVDDDTLFGIKSSFGAMIGVRDEKETARLKKLAAHLRPILAQIARWPKERQLPETEVADLAFVSGVDNHSALEISVQTDASMVAAGMEPKHPKTVVFRNATETKFDAMLKPIADTLLARARAPEVQFDGFFTAVVFITWVDALLSDSARSQKLREAYAPFSFAAVVAGGIWALEKLAEQHEPGVASPQVISTTAAAMLIRWLRYDIGTPTGRSALLDLNYLFERGAMTFDADGRIVPTDKMAGALDAMAHELMGVYVRADYAKANELLQKYGTLRPEFAKLLERVKDVPVDVDAIMVAN